MKRKAGTRTDRNTILNRNCLRHESITKSSDNESTHLVENEFKILQSLIPGISDQHEISELQLIDGEQDLQNNGTLESLSTESYNSSTMVSVCNSSTRTTTLQRNLLRTSQQNRPNKSST